MQISNQIVLVTGASRGLGAAIAKEFVAEGARVIVNYHRSAERAKSLADELGKGALAIEADVSNAKAVRRMFTEAESTFGQPVNTVINNALADYSFNGEERAKIQDIPWDDFAAQLAVSLRGALNTTQAAVPSMARENFGRIITIGTNLFQNPVVPYHDYTAAKAALLAFTRTACADLGPSGISVNMVSGGLLRTTDASAGTPESVFNMIAEMTPLRRVTTPQEFAAAVLFFASPWSRAVTGQNLVVDGGLVKD